MSWKRVGKKYEFKAHLVKGTVYQDGEYWRNEVHVTGDGLTDKGEWMDREVAFKNCEGGMYRACNFRRFEKNPPKMPNQPVDDDEIDEDPPE